MKNNGYTGRKLVEYIWIPKSKTDLREYREFLKICNTVQTRDGFFSDKSIGMEMVKSRAIVDRDNTAESYIEKYGIKKTADQSYVSNARMLLRILRWMGLISKDFNPNIRGKYYLTHIGKIFTNFSGSFPAIYHEISELDLFEESFAGMRYYCVNDEISYRNTTFKQRVFLNMIRFLDLLGFASHYELALSSLVLKNESQDEIHKKLDKINKCRENKNLRWLMQEYRMNCDDKSTVTGIYDGPKVLLSFAKQLGLAQEIDVNSSQKAKELYRRIYKDCGYIAEFSAKKITKVTEKGINFLKKYSDRTLVWFDKLKKADKLSALILITKNKSQTDIKLLKNLDLHINDLSSNIFEIKNDKITLKGYIDYDLYRDVPYEHRKQVIDIINNIDADYFLKNEDFELEKYKVFLPKDYPEKRCIDCFLGKCCYYRKNLNSYGGRDRFPWRVCPEDLLSFDNNGVLNIKTDKCVGCGLCALKCSFDGISYDKKFKFHKIDNKKDKTLLLTEDKKNSLTTDLEKKYPKKIFLFPLKDIPLLVNNFVNSINNANYRWNKDACYTYVRNVFRLFGVDALYSGSGGMKTRSDVTIEAPFIAVSEVKSPSESPVNLKAVRQAVDAAVQKQTKLTMAIGIEIHAGAIEQEKKYRMISKIKVLLLKLQYLSFISYMSQYIKFTPDSLKRLISNNEGEFNKFKLNNYLIEELKYCHHLINPSQINILINSTFV